MTFGRRARRTLRRAFRFWRRSLQVRVVATTLVVSGAVVILLGIVVLQQVREGVLQTKVRNALNEQSVGLLTVEAQLDGSPNTDPNQLLYQIVGNLTTLRSGQAGNYDVVIRGTSPSGDVAPRTSNGIQESSVPQALIDAVTTGHSQYYTYTTMRYDDGTKTPGVVVGGVVTTRTSGTYQLYYLFSLQQEQQTLELVARTLVFTGLGLVVLLVGIAWLVTRQVVTPVRLAARTAERLAAGGLNERMRVKGEDDLARLASSFNKMAVGLQRHIRQLEELSRMQRRFVSDVSHELRTPLTTVRMAADVLHEARDRFEPEVARSAELLQTQLDRFEELLADLLEVSRHDAGAVALDVEPVDMCALVRGVVEATDPIAAHKGSTITLHLPDDGCPCDADSRRVERILRNLLVNAIEHGEGREVEVRVAADESAVAVAVRDHGVGLRPGEASLVFNRFWRADPARARTTGGTGLGLSIAWEDARLHGGRLQAWGRRGGGSQFVLTLPRTVGAPLASEPLPLQPADARVWRPEPPIAPEPAAPEPPAVPAPSEPGVATVQRGGHG